MHVKPIQSFGCRCRNKTMYLLKERITILHFTKKREKKVLKFVDKRCDTMDMEALVGAYISPCCKYVVLTNVTKYRSPLIETQSRFWGPHTSG